QDESLLSKEGIPDGYSGIRKISHDEVKGFEETFMDTVVYLKSEDDYEPIRLLEDVFEHDNSFYKIQVSTSMVEEDDLVQSLLISLLWLYFGLIISILILNNLLLKKVWNPFYKFRSQLKNYSIEKDDGIIFESSN